MRLSEPEPAEHATDGRLPYSSKRMLHAVLVSDEIVEADHIETINNDTGIGNSS